MASCFGLAGAFRPMSENFNWKNKLMWIFIKKNFLKDLRGIVFHAAIGFLRALPCWLSCFNGWSCWCREKLSGPAIFMGR